MSRRHQPSKPVRIGRTRGLRAFALSFLAAAAGCLDDAPVAPTMGTVNLEIRAQVGPDPGERTVAIRVYYFRQSEQQVDLPVTPSTVVVPRGGTSTRQIAVQISGCLADPQRITGESETGCLFFVELVLLDESGEPIGSETQDAEASTPGQQVPLEPFNLGPPGRLTLSADGVGSGTIVSSPAGIQCTLDDGLPSAGCTAEFQFGTVVTLSITPDEGSLFDGWSGACSGTADCMVTMTADRDVMAGLAPKAGGDFVMFGDTDLFQALALENPDNRRLATNLVGFANSGPRASGSVVQIDCGRQGPLLDCTFSELSSVLEGAGYQTSFVPSTRDGLTNIPASVKLLVLVVPCTGFSSAELIALRAFGADGGRILLLTEYESFFGDNWQACSTAQNQLAGGLGTSLRIEGGVFDPGFSDEETEEVIFPVLPAESLRPHQITLRMQSLTLAAASSISTGEGGSALFFDSHNEVPLGAVDEIDTGPLPQQLLPSSIGSLSIGEIRLLPWTNLPSSTGR